MKRMVTLSMLLLSFNLWALSAEREPGIDGRVYEKKYLGPQAFQMSTGRSAHSRAKISPTDALPDHQHWGQGQLQSRFEMLRDFPIIDGKWTPSWRYPEDGCYARASMANKTAFHNYYPLPGKVFAFGNLSVQSSHSPRGSVSWWYHVAPIVEVDGEKYVLDPAIEFSRPLSLSEWLGRMGDASKIKVSFCESGTYIPSDSCEDKTDGLELSALRSQRSYLKLEASRRDGI